MDRLLKMAGRLTNDRGRRWKLDGSTIDVRLGEGSRHQVVRLSKKGEFYVLTSVILGSTSVTASDKRWRDLAVMAWEKNAAYELVTFAFDRQDRLVGQIRHPADHLDAEELALYVATLARECDRFEYILRGGDWF